MIPPHKKKLLNHFTTFFVCENPIVSDITLIPHIISLSDENSAVFAAPRRNHLFYMQKVKKNGRIFRYNKSAFFSKRVKQLIYQTSNSDILATKWIMLMATLKQCSSIILALKPPVLGKWFKKIVPSVTDYNETVHDLEKASKNHLISIIVKIYLPHSISIVSYPEIILLLFAEIGTYPVAYYHCPWNQKRSIFI